MNYNADGILYPKKDDQIENWWVIFTYVMGVPLAIARLSEPFVWEVFKLKVLKCKSKQNKITKYSSDSLL